MYTDFDKDLPAAKNVAELRQQYDTIDAYTDRTDLMKNYLKQKAATRSLLQSVGTAGYGNYFYDNAHKKDSWLPHKYKDDDVEDIPAWMNKGEQGVPEWVDLSDSRRKKEVDNQNVYSDFITEWTFDPPSDTISEYGKAHGMTDKQRQKLEDDRVKAAQDFSNIQDQTQLDGIPFNNRVKTGKRAFNAYWSKKIKRRNNKIRVMQRIKELHDAMDQNEAGFGWHDKEDTPYVDKTTTMMGEEVTYQKVVEWINSDKTAPEYELGEPSRAHFYKALLEGVYSWAPKNLTLDEENLPDKYIQGLEPTFKHMLAHLDPADRQRADRLHNMAHAPDTAAYMEKYHPDAKQDVDVAKDAAGTTELFSDWDLPYEKNVNQVKFNNHLHRQMDFGVSEDV